MYSLRLRGPGESEKHTYRVVHEFAGAPNDGSQPHSGVILAGDSLFGMTAKGGTNNKGALFSIKPDGSGFRLLYSFETQTGSDPHGRLTLGSDGHTLFGMARKGGSKGHGTVFSFDPISSKYTVLHDLMGGTPRDRSCSMAGSGGASDPDCSKTYGTVVESGTRGLLQPQLSLVRRHVSRLSEAKSRSSSADSGQASPSAKPLYIGSKDPTV